MIIVLVKDLYAAHLGYDAGMGLLAGAGAHLNTLLLLPGIEEKLLSSGFAITFEEWERRQAKAKRAPDNKRGRGARENKAR